MVFSITSVYSPLQLIFIHSGYIGSAGQMAGSIAYVSFPQFTRTRRPIMSTMCRRFIEALMTLSWTGSCFPRPGRALQNESSQDPAQARIVDAKPRCPATQPADTPATEPLASTRPRYSDLPKNHIPDPQIPKYQATSSSSSSSSSIPASSLRSLPSTLRASLIRRVSSWSSDHSDPWPIEHAERQAITPEHTGTSTSESDYGDFIAELDALALSQHEREVLARMQLVCRSARVARGRRVGRQDWNDFDGISGVEPGVCLRGGGDDDDVRAFRTPRRRTTLPVDEPPKLDSARPPRALWWLAGGRKGRVPTVGELRVRKEVERANRKIVGFWGTVLGVRRVGSVGILDEGGHGGGDEDRDAGGGGDGGGLENADAGSSHRSKSIESIMGAPGASGGGSVASSRREREIKVDQPVESKPEDAMSAASAEDGVTHAKPDVMDDTAKDRDSTKSGSVMDTGVEEPMKKSESAKSVAEDHESTKTGSANNAGVEEPKARSESAKSVAEDTRAAEAGSVRSREGVAETGARGEEESKSPSDG